MDRWVGMANTIPDSRMPRRLTMTIKMIATKPMAMRCSKSDGTAEVIAATPAATLTATVST